VLFGVVVTGGGSFTVTVGVGVDVRRACITTGDGVLVSVGTASALVGDGTPVAGCSCGNGVVCWMESGRAVSTSTSPPSTTATPDASASRPPGPAASGAGARRSDGTPAAALRDARAAGDDREPTCRGCTPVCRSSSSTVTRSRRLRALRVMHDLHLFPPPPRSPAAA
jgi:hypothetical protein